MQSSQPKIIIENPIKIYGNNPRKALKMFRDGATKDYILEATGNVVGVADVSLEISEGELSWSWGYRVRESQHWCAALTV